MAFPREILLTGINIADTMTKGVQSTVQHEVFTSSNGDGDESYATAVPVQCVVDQTRKQHRSANGRLVTTVAELTFPRGGVLISPKDRITLADGTTGPLILDAPNAVMDPMTGRGFIATVKIGEVASTPGA